MKVFLKKGVLIFLYVFIAILACKFLLPSNKNYNSAFVKKLELLKENRHVPKIVLIGGSAVGWGISAEIIENATKIKTINLGHHVGYGLMDYQAYILENISKNDIIIFSPEWVFFDNPDFFDKATLEDLYSNYEYIRLLKKPLHFFVKSLFLRTTSLRQHSLHRGDPYRYDCLNKNGDVISHCGLSPKGTSDYVVQFDNFSYATFKQKFKFLEWPNTFVVFPPTQRGIYQKNLKKFTFLQQSLLSSPLKIVDSISSNVYPEIDFYDREYHLMCEKKETRTLKVIKYILSRKSSVQASN